MPVKIPAHIREQEINELPNIKFVRWLDGYRNAHSKAICRCTVDGFEWSASVSNLLDYGSGCPQCSGVRRWTADERIGQINSIPNVKFVRWGEGTYRGVHSKAVCRCSIDDSEWSASVNSIVNRNQGCRRCADVLRADKRRTPSDERVSQINDLPNIRFIRWLTSEYRNTNSKAVCRCDKGHEWSASVKNLLNLGTGCPECVMSGYNPSKPGTLYALRSECGTMVKIGISNDYTNRHTTLKRTTPFSWDCTELLHGDGALIAALEKAFHGMTEPVTFSEPFDGHTEWRKWTPELVDWFNTWREMT